MPSPAYDRIRPATARDAERIVALWTAAYVDEGQGGRSAPYSEDDFLATARLGQLTVAECDGVAVGVVALFAPGTAEPAVARADEAELSRLAVTASARRLGIGRALAGRCEVIARAEGWRAIALWSRPYQRAAHRLYESLGYRRAPERDSSDESGHGRLVFRLDL
jgi:ribosomal protein S18 acetylase RimI-like enzyme